MPITSERFLQFTLERMQELVNTSEYGMQEKRIRGLVKLEHVLERMVPLLPPLEQSYVKAILALNAQLWPG